MILTDRQIRLRCQFQGKRITVNRDWGAQHKAGASFFDQDPLHVEAVYAQINQINAALLGDVFTIEDIEEAKTTWLPMIAPFIPQQVRRVYDVPEGGYRIEEMGILSSEESRKIVSYGLSSMGYDVKLARNFKIFTNVNSQIIDPLNMSEKIYHEEMDADFCIIPPNSYILGHTEEYFRIPKNILALCLGKSTYARCGAIVNATPIEPGFEGRVVIEISNATNLPLKVYAGQGIAQFLFLQSSEDCEVGYGDRDGGKGGKYQGQEGLQTALV